MAHSLRSLTSLIALGSSSSGQGGDGVPRSQDDWENEWMRIGTQVADRYVPYDYTWSNGQARNRWRRAIAAIIRLLRLRQKWAWLGKYLQQSNCATLFDRVERVQGRLRNKSERSGADSVAHHVDDRETKGSTKGKEDGRQGPRHHSDLPPLIIPVVESMPPDWARALLPLMNNQATFIASLERQAGAYTKGKGKQKPTCTVETLPPEVASGLLRVLRSSPSQLHNALHTQSVLTQDEFMMLGRIRGLQQHFAAELRRQNTAAQTNIELNMFY